MVTFLSYYHRMVCNMHQSKESDSLNESLDVVEQKMDALQAQLSLGAIIGSVALAAQHMVESVHAARWITLTVALISLGGWLLFGVSLLRMRRLGLSPAGKIYNANAVRDERMKMVRLESFTFGFAAVLIFQVLVVVAWVFAHDVHGGLLSVPVVAPTTIAVGVTASLIRFQILSKR